jgi:hypothetical protein
VKRTSLEYAEALPSRGVLAVRGDLEKRPPAPLGETHLPPVVPDRLVGGVPQEHLHLDRLALPQHGLPYDKAALETAAALTAILRRSRVRSAGSGGGRPVFRHGGKGQGEGNQDQRQVDRAGSRRAPRPPTAVDVCFSRPRPGVAI